MNKFNVGRKYSQRVRLHEPDSPLEATGDDVDHRLNIPAIKSWAVDLLRQRGVPVDELIERGVADGWLNEGRVLREHIDYTQGVERNVSMTLRHPTGLI